MDDELIIPVDKHFAKMMELICETLGKRFDMELPLTVVAEDEGIYVTVTGGRVLIARTALREFHTPDGLRAYLNGVKVQNSKVA